MSTPVECRYSVEGNGPPLFLIHGIGAARDAWRFIVPKIRSNFTVITYDLRGHGKSPKPTTKFLLDDLVEDLEYLRKKLNFNKAYFAGHSLGGMIAPAYALKYSRRVLALGLFSTAAGRTKYDREKILAVIKSMEELGVSKVLPTLIDRWFTDYFISSSPDIIERRIQQVINTDPEVFMNVFRIYANTEMGPWLHKIKYPTLILTGEKDAGCNPKLNKFIAEQIPNSKLIILPNYKHSLLIEAPNEIADNIIDFF
jgi:pimeloyl-ACP methyl ester carboxylesterase